jgi:transcription elongation GreA/GreB family factor
MDSETFRMRNCNARAGSISFVSPVARFLMGKAVGDVVGTSGQELEIIAIS